MPHYDDTLFGPPAPVAQVTLRNPDTGMVVLDVPMLLDSGADVTLIPQVALNRLDISSVQDKTIQIDL